MSRADYTEAKLVERKDVSDELAVFQFLVSEPLSFTAGQYATIGIESDGKLVERPYSIVSSPYERFLEFFIELVPEGIFTPKLWDLRLGATILLRRRIVGQFTLDHAVKRHLMIGTVTGVAPFVSMLRTHHLDRERRPQLGDHFVVIHGASRSPHFGPYIGELEKLSRDGWLTYIPTISRPWDEAQWQGETGRCEDVLRKHADRMGFNHSNSVAYTCGHPGMVENVKGILGRARFVKGQIREEEYFALPDSNTNDAECLAIPKPSV